MANAVHENLEYDVEVTVWNQGVFDLSSYTLEEILSALDDADFGLFVFSPDDVAKIRGRSHEAVRDNVILEFGLFVGRLGKERSFFLLPRGHEQLRIPTDLLGLTPATYEPSREDGNLVAALGPACSRLKRQMENLQGSEEASRSIPGAAQPARAPVCRSVNGYLAAVREALLRSSEETWVFTRDRAWIFPLFPTLMAARLKEKKIRVVYQLSPEDRWPSYRYSLLAAMGCSLVVLPPEEALPFQGLLADAEIYGKSTLIVRTPGSEREGLYATVYTEPQDFEVCRLVGAAQLGLAKRAKQARGAIGLKRTIPDPVYDRLRRYMDIYEPCDFSLESVAVAQTKPIERTLRRFKIEQAKSQIQLYRDKGFDLFEWISLTMPNQADSVLLPPVVEEHRNDLYVINGHSRLYAAMQLGLDEVKAFVVRGVEVPLPADPTDWSEVKVKSESVLPEEKWLNIRPDFIRRIENSVRRDIELPFEIGPPQRAQRVPQPD